MMLSEFLKIKLLRLRHCDLGKRQNRERLHGRRFENKKSYNYNEGIIVDKYNYSG